MKARDLLSKKEGISHSIHPDDPVQKAVKKMAEHRIGSLLVIDEKEQLRGIFTERDLLNRINRSGPAVLEAKVAAVMTRDLVIGKADDTIDQLSGIMTQQSVRHLPIFDGSKLVGVLSIGDLVKAQLNQTQYELTLLQDYVEGKYPG